MCGGPTLRPRGGRFKHCGSHRIPQLAGLAEMLAKEASLHMLPDLVIANSLKTRRLANHLWVRHRLAMVRQYKHLSEEEQKHFVEHGWLKVPGAIKQEYIDAWMADLWVRLGWDPKDKSTWTEPYVKMPRHREAAVEDFCPDAWNKM